jgi:hypothetical protein
MNYQKGYAVHIVQFRETRCDGRYLFQGNEFLKMNFMVFCGLESGGTSKVPN